MKGLWNRQEELKVITDRKKSNKTGLLKPPGRLCMMAMLKALDKTCLGRAQAARGEVAHSPPWLVWGWWASRRQQTSSACVSGICFTNCNRLWNQIGVLQRGKTLCSPIPGAGWCPPSALGYVARKTVLEGKAQAAEGQLPLLSWQAVQLQVPHTLGT